MRKLLGLIILAVIGFYVVWPAWSGYKIATALSVQDAAALEGKIDFPSVRESLKPAVTAEVGKRIDQQLKDAGPAAQGMAGQLKGQMQGKIVDQVLQALVTPQNVIKIAHEGGDIAKSVERMMGQAGGQMGGAGGLGAILGSIGGGGGSGGGTGGGGGLGGVLGQVLGGAAGGGAAGGVDLGGILGKALGGGKAAEQPAPAAKTDTASGAAPKRSFGMGNLKGFSFAGPFAFNASVARDAAAPKADATFGMSFTGGDWKLTSVVPNL